MKFSIISTATKIDLSVKDESVADILGISAVIINDLKQRRQRDYDFSWDKALQVNGDTGIKLQYTHCRLCSLEENFNNLVLPESVNLELLSEPEAQNLIFEICRYSEVIHKSQESLEACILVNYLFGLCNSTSKALKVLNVKNTEDGELKAQRLLLFMTSKKILNSGMKILGLKPLREM